MRTNERKNLIYIYCLCIFICVLLSFAVSMRIMKGLADGENEYSLSDISADAYDEVSFEGDKYAVSGTDDLSGFYGGKSITLKNFVTSTFTFDLKLVANEGSFYIVIGNPGDANNIKLSFNVSLSESEKTIKSINQYKAKLILDDNKFLDATYRIKLVFAPNAEREFQLTIILSDITNNKTVEKTFSKVSFMTDASGKCGVYIAKKAGDASLDFILYDSDRRTSSPKLTVKNEDGSVFREFVGNEISVADDNIKTSDFETSKKRFVGYEVNGKLYEKLSDIPTLTEDAEATVKLADLYLVYGASVRIGTPTGIRFTGIIGKDDIYSDYGMFLTAGDYLDSADDMTVEYLNENNYNYKIIRNSDGMQIGDTEDGNIYFSLVLSNVKAVNYAHGFAARAFTVVTYANEKTKTIYSDFSFDANLRSIYKVASEYFNKGGTNSAMMNIVDSVLDLSVAGDEVVLCGVERSYSITADVSEDAIVVTLTAKDGSPFAAENVGTVMLDGKITDFTITADGEIKISLR